MFKKTINLLTIFTLTILLSLQPIPTIVLAETDNDEQITSEIGYQATVLSENDEEIALYTEPSESSEIILLLDNGDEVSVLEELEHFSYVEFTNVREESEETLDDRVIIGYIDNNFIQEANQNIA